MVSSSLQCNKNDSPDDSERSGERNDSRSMATVSSERADLLPAFVPVTFERTNDIKLVGEIARHSKIYPASSDDYAPPPQDWSPLQHESIWHVLVRDVDELLGMFVFIPESRICWRIHVCLLPCSYGERTSEAFSEVTKWMFRNSPVLRLVGSVPKYNTLACRLARLGGWKQFGVNEQSWMKHGKLHDMLMFRSK